MNAAQNLQPSAVPKRIAPAALIKWATRQAAPRPVGILDYLVDLLGGEWIEDAPTEVANGGWYFLRHRRTTSGGWRGQGDWAGLLAASQDEAARIAIRYFWPEILLITQIMDRITARDSSMSYTQRGVTVEFDGKYLISFDNSRRHSPWDPSSFAELPLVYENRPIDDYVAIGARFAYWMLDEYTPDRERHLVTHTKQDGGVARYKMLPTRASGITVGVWAKVA